MLVQWAWLDSFGNYLGEYQSDTDDLKAFMARYSRFSGMYMLYCKRQDGKQYLWRNPRWFKADEYQTGWITL